MLESIWATLGNYGLDLDEISTAIHSLIDFDAEGNAIGGTLKDMANLPVIGEILKALAGFAPVVTTSIS